MALTKIKLNSMVTGTLPDANIPNDITIDTASASPASALTGNTLASGVTASSLTSVGSLTGLTIAGTGTNAAPTLAIDNSSSSSYIHSIEALGANMTQGQNNIINLGKIGSTKNSAVIGYKWDSAGSNNNLLTFEHWGTGPLITMDGVGNTAITGTVTIGTQQGGKELMTNRARMRHIDGVADANASFSHGDLYVNHISTGNIYMQRNTTFAGQALIKEGAFNNLSLAFSNDTDTGIYNGGVGATAFVQNGSIALELQSSLTAEFRGLIKHKGTSNSDYGNTAFETRAGNNSQGLKISHGGGNGKLELFGSNQSRTQFYANQITANVNGLEIKTTDAQSLTLGTNNSTRVTVNSSGNTSFAGDVTISKSNAQMTIFSSNAGDHESLVFDRNTASNGDSQEIKWKLQGSNYPGGYIRHEYIEAANSKLEFGCRENNTVTKMMTIGSSGDIQANRHSFIQGVADGRRGFMFSGGGGTNFGYPNVQGSGYYGMVFGRESINESGGGHYIAKSHWGGISIIGFSGSGVQGIDIVAWGYGNGGATVLKSGNWVGSLYRSYSTVNYHLVVDVGTTVNMFSILIGI